MKTEYFVGIDATQPAGALLMVLNGKIGGATAHFQVNSVTHPLIVATDIDWSLLPAVVRMTHIQNPGTDNPQPREFVVPASSVLMVVQVTPRPEGPPAEQTAKPPLH